MRKFFLVAVVAVLFLSVFAHSRRSKAFLQASVKIHVGERAFQKTSVFLQICVNGFKIKVIFLSRGG